MDTGDVHVISSDETEDKENDSASNEDVASSTASSYTTRSSTASSYTTRSSTSRGSRSSKRRYSGRRKPKKPIAGYKFNASYTEDHKTVIYGIAFNHFLPTNQPPIFATVGSNRCSIYKCLNEGGIKFLNCYADPDPEEAFYTCNWSYSRKTRRPLLIVAGQRGVIRIINTANQRNQHSVAASLVGHGGSINQLKIHPIQVHLLLSCSKDYALRLWNMETQALIAVFGGVEAHRAEVLSADFDLRGQRFVSGGMDHALKIWDISSDAAFEERIQLSAQYSAKSADEQFPTLMQHYPTFSTREIHGNYVDCVQWFGDYIVSKSCQDLIVIWRVGERRVSGKLKPEVIAQFQCNNCELWFVRFDFNIWCHMLACGNELGHIFVWELSQVGPHDARAYKLTRKGCNSTVRQVAFSKDAKVLMAVCDDGTIWRWNKVIK